MATKSGRGGRLRNYLGWRAVTRAAAQAAHVPEERLQSIVDRGIADPQKRGELLRDLPDDVARAMRAQLLELETPEGQLKNIEKTYTKVAVQEVWVEVPINDEWIVAYRLIPQDGVPVIGELRIFPKHPAGESAPGRWHCELLGFAAPVPTGGLSARLLREVTVGAHLRFGSEALAAFEAAPGLTAVFPFYEVEPFTRAAMPPKRKGPGGRPRRPDLFYARLAATYVDSLHAGHKNPVERVAAAAKLPVKRVRTMLHEARSRRLLAGGHQGRATGALTPRAQALLKMVRRRSSKRGGRR